MRANLRACVIGLVALAASGCGGGDTGGGITTGWTSAVVKASASVRSTAIAIDPAGQPHVAFVDQVTAKVFYGTRTGGAWSSVAVPGTDNADEGMALAFDASGHPHLAFQVDNGVAAGGTRYAFYDGSAWYVETVESAVVGARTASISLALTSAGLPVVSYWPGDGQGLKVASRDAGGTWSTATADATANAGFHGTSIVLDSANRPLVSYYVYGTRTLRLATFSGTSWSSEAVATPADAWEQVGEWSSLVLDGSGKPRVAYLHFDGTSVWSVKYAVKGTSSWTLETVGAGSVGPALALAADGSPWVAWGVAPASWIKAAKRVAGAWVTETLPATSADWTLDLAVDGAGVPHLAYDSGSTGAAMYATRL